MSAIAKEVLIKTGNALPIITKSTQPKSLYRALKVMDGNGVGEAVVSFRSYLLHILAQQPQQPPVLANRRQGDSALAGHTGKRVGGLALALLIDRSSQEGAITGPGVYQKRISYETRQNVQERFRNTLNTSRKPPQE